MYLIDSFYATGIIPSKPSQAKCPRFVKVPRAIREVIAYRTWVWFLTSDGRCTWAERVMLRSPCTRSCCSTHSSLRYETPIHSVFPTEIY